MSHPKPKIRLAFARHLSLRPGLTSTLGQHSYATRSSSRPKSHRQGRPSRKPFDRLSLDTTGAFQSLTGVSQPILNVVHELFNWKCTPTPRTAEMLGLYIDSHKDQDDIAIPLLTLRSCMAQAYCLAQIVALNMIRSSGPKIPDDISGDGLDVQMELADGQ